MMEPEVTQREAVDIENRRFALDRAQSFFKNTSGSPGGVMNAAAIVNVADMYAKFVSTGELPDFLVECADVARFSWNIAESMFGPAIATEARKKAAGEK